MLALVYGFLSFLKGFGLNLGIEVLKSENLTSLIPTGSDIIDILLVVWYRALLRVFIIFWVKSWLLLYKNFFGDFPIDKSRFEFCSHLDGCLQ